MPNKHVQAAAKKSRVYSVGLRFAVGGRGSRLGAGSRDALNRGRGSAREPYRSIRVKNVTLISPSLDVDTSILLTCDCPILRFHDSSIYVKRVRNCGSERTLACGGNTEGRICPTPPSLRGLAHGESRQGTSSWESSQSICVGPSSQWHSGQPE